MNLLATAYEVAPYPLKVTGASLQGLALRRARYGPETSDYVQEALGREGWSRQEWAQWTDGRLAEVLFAASTAAAYDGVSDHPGDPPAARLCGWPVLRKETLRHRPGAFLPPTVRRARLRESHTSGSTGTPLRLWVSRRALRFWYSLFEARWRRWNGVNRFDRWAIIGGQLVVPIDRRKPPFWVWNAPMRQLYVSSYHIAPWSAPHIIDAMKRSRVVYLWGYASALAELAREVAEQRLAPPELRVVISNAEPLYDWQRELISQAFGCRVVNTYGMSEMVAAASECEHGRMHLWPEAGIVEVLDDEDLPVPAGGGGRLVCTGLVNDAMPLIRYEVGDRGALAPEGETCPCGRTLPILRSVEGRLDDVVMTPDGRRIGRLDTVFKADLPIRAAQIVQEALDEVRVLLVPGQGFRATTADTVRSLVSERIGHEMRVHVEQVDDIPKSANGKRRLVVSQIATGAREAGGT